MKAFRFSRLAPVFGAALLISQAFAQEAAAPAAEPAVPKATATAKNNYFDFGFSGNFIATGYRDLDFSQRFGVNMELGMGHYALPLNFSFGDSTFIVGVKPRFQLWIQPIPNLPAFLIGPGIAPVFNYWRADTLGGSVDAYELGIQPSVRVRYQVTPEINVIFVPMEMDFNFWRHASAQFPGFSGSGSSTELAVFYNIQFLVGVNF
jgi:hypothetical protein